MLDRAADARTPNGESSSIRSHHEDHRQDRRSGQRYRQGPSQERRHHTVPLTEDGFPAAVPDAPKLSPIVFVSDESRARYPWLPKRAIAGSVWDGPRQERVRIDEDGDAAGWPARPASVR